MMNGLTGSALSGQTKSPPSLPGGGWMVAQYNAASHTADRAFLFNRLNVLIGLGRM